MVNATPDMLHFLTSFIVVPLGDYFLLTLPPLDLLMLVWQSPV